MIWPGELLTTLDDLSERLPVIRILCNWFTEVPSLTSPIVHRQCDVMRRDRASDRWSASFDGFHGCTGRSVLKYNP